MKATRALLALATALIFSGSVSGQVSFINLEKMTEYRQTDATTVNLKAFVPNPTMGQPPLSAPYQFRVTVDGPESGGTAINLITQPLFKGTPAGSYDMAGNGAGTDGVNHGKLFYNGSEDSWGRVFYFPLKTSASGGPPSGSGAGGLDGLFPNGTFQLSFDGGTTYKNLSLGSTDYFAVAPKATSDVGYWSGGSLILNENQAFNLSTTWLTNFETLGNGLNHIGIFLSGNSGEIASTESFSTSFPNDVADGNYLGDTIALQRLAGLTAGNYMVEIEFNTVMDLNTVDFSAPAVALFTSRTQFSIQVVPEPSTYAAILGAVALVGVAIHRRRRVIA